MIGDFAKSVRKFTTCARVWGVRNHGGSSKDQGVCIAFVKGVRDGGLDIVISERGVVKRGESWHRELPDGSSRRGMGVGKRARTTGRGFARVVRS